MSRISLRCTRPCFTRYEPSGPAALPVAGSSMTPALGANMRLYTVTFGSPVSIVKNSAPTCPPGNALVSFFIAARSASAASTAARVLTGISRNALPHDTSSIGMPVASTAAGSRPTERMMSGRGEAGARNSGVRWSIHANDSRSPSHVSSTLVGPTPRPNTKLACPFLITPRSASAKVLPIVGWPAIGSSVPGVKMRMRTSVPAASAGRMNVHSEKFISLVIACICAVDSPRASWNTASWLPSNMVPVNTS